MKKTLLFAVILVSTTSFSQKKLTANSARHLDESGAVTGADSSVYTYADFQGSLLSNGPVLGMAGNVEPYLWNWNTPDPDFTSADFFFNGSLNQTYAKLYDGSHRVLSNTDNANGNRYSYTYTATGKVATYRQEYFSGGSWYPNSGTDYFYDASDRVVVQNGLSYPSGTAVITEADSITYVGTTMNISRAVTYSSSDGITFDPQNKVDNTFSGNTLVSFNYFVDFDNDPSTPLDWLVAVTNTYTGSNLTSVVGYLVNAGVPTTNIAIQIDYTYDGSNRVLTENQSGQLGLTGHDYYYDAQGFVTRVTSLEETQAGGDVYPSQDEYFYYQSTASLEEAATIDFSVFPNPSKDVLNISSDDAINALVVYSMDGKKLIVQKGENTINISNLPQGNYLLEVVTAKGAARKMITKN